MCMEDWIKIIHPGTDSATTIEMKKLYAEKNNTSHCSICLNLNGCYFIQNKCPDIPHHPNCHCYLESANKSLLKAECDDRKLRDYILSEKSDKFILFSLWGYSKIDVEYLKNEYERQALEAYSNGNYSLGLLNNYGQRIEIVMHLPKKEPYGYAFFKTAWMVYPEGIIKNVTPYGGNIKK